MQHNKTPLLFDKKLVRLRRSIKSERLLASEFLHRRAMQDVVDRLESINRSFDQSLFFGTLNFSDLLTKKASVNRIIFADPAKKCLSTNAPNCQKVVADEEFLPFAGQKFDLIVNLLLLHHSNDLIGALVQARQSLKPDGLFIGVMFGEDTIDSVRAAFYEAESNVSGGVTPRVSPLGRVKDLGNALQRAGFALPVVDVDRLKVTYKNPMNVIQDLRDMGETNAMNGTQRPLQRAVVFQALSSLQSKHTVTNYDLVTLTGWAPSNTQQKPLKPGSAEKSMAEAVNRTTSRKRL